MIHVALHLFIALPQQHWPNSSNTKDNSNSMLSSIVFLLGSLRVCVRHRKLWCGDQNRHRTSKAVSVHCHSTTKAVCLGEGGGGGGEPRRLGPRPRRCCTDRGVQPGSKWWVVPTDVAGTSALDVLWMHSRTCGHLKFDIPTPSIVTLEIVLLVDSMLSMNDSWTIRTGVRFVSYLKPIHVAPHPHRYPYCNHVMCFLPGPFQFHGVARVILRAVLKLRMVF